jgi:cob(I)alamin adenosyltransferase
MYTRTGDKGETGLFSGERVSKSTLRVDAYGTVDELSSWVGYTRSMVEDNEIASILERIQLDLFRLGADLATRQIESNAWKVEVTQAMVDQVEREIDRLDAGLPVLSGFIVPYGTHAAAALHVARAVARRAERRTVVLAESERLNPVLVPYLNRLSSLLFVLARVVNKRAGVGEKTWSSRSQNRT